MAGNRTIILASLSPTLFRCPICNETERWRKLFLILLRHVEDGILHLPICRFRLAVGFRRPVLNFGMVCGHFLWNRFDCWAMSDLVFILSYVWLHGPIWCRN